MDNREYLLYRLRRNPTNHVFIDLECEIDNDGIIHFSKAREFSGEAIVEDDYWIYITRSDGLSEMLIGGSIPTILYFSEKSDNLDTVREGLPSSIIEAYRLWKQRTDVKEEIKISDHICEKRYYISDTPNDLQ